MAGEERSNERTLSGHGGPEGIRRGAARFTEHPSSWDGRHHSGRTAMSVARVSEISATSSQSFEDAIRQGLERATRSLRGVTSAWIKEQRVKLRDGQIAEYQVNLQVTFVLED
jgi:dodecin